MPALVPGGSAGDHLALSRWSAVAGEERRFPANGEDGDDAAEGGTGAVLARLALDRLPGEGDASGPPSGKAGGIASADRFLAEMPDDDAAGALEAAEVAVTAFQVHGLERHRAAARTLAGSLLARRPAAGSWFPERWAADRYHLSAISGLAAVLHLLLKVHVPERVGSIRLLE
jgi:hypothetical protein